MDALTAMKQALEALDGYCSHAAILTPFAVRDALRASVEEIEKMEPVAWEYATDLSEDRILTNKSPSQMQDWLGRAAHCITSARPLYSIKIK